MNEHAVASFVSNAVWMALVITVLCAGLERARVHPRIRELAWTAGLLLSVLTPLAGLLPRGGSSMLPDFRFTATIGETSGTAAGFAWSWYFAVGYLALVALAAVRLARSWQRLQRLTEETVSAPLTFGLVRPRVLLPAGFRQAAAPLAVEAALAHERTHLRRRDFARNFLLELVTLPVSFHPAVWHMKVRLAQARELVCDDLTACAFGDRRRYAQGLVEAARVLAQPSSGPSRLAMGMLDHTDFEERIMLLNDPAPARFRRGYLLLGAMLACAPAMTLFGFYFQSDETVYKIGDGVMAPKVSYKEEPRYSEATKDAKIDGTVILGIEISRSGLAEKIVVKRGVHAELDANAVECVRRWRFDPATKDNVPVRVAAMIEVNFKLK